MKRILALIYKSYEARNLNNSYFRALMTIIGPLLFVIILAQGILKLHLLEHSSMGLLYLILGLFICLLLIIFSRVYKKEDLNYYQFTHEQLQPTTRYLIVYLIGIFLLVTGTLILRMTHII
jgi:c-di-AMP phosphodiesterase-like protein